MATRVSRSLPRVAVAGSAPRARTSTMPWRALAAAGAIAVIISIGLILYLDRGSTATPLAGFEREYLLFAEFGLHHDTIYEAPLDRPYERKKLLEARHAAEFGITAAPSPDSRGLAYLALPPGSPPLADAPAELWLASLEGKAKPLRLGAGFDVKVAPVWSPDGATVIVRRSESEAAYELVAVDTTRGATATLASSQAALFPIAFTPDGASFYYASAAASGSDLHRVGLASRALTFIAHLSDELTRDWRLSPAGDKLAFVTLTPSEAGYVSRVRVLYLATGAVGPSMSEAEHEFGPAWSANGELTLGSTRSNAYAVEVGGVASRRPAAGFDAPLAWSRSGSALAVRSFRGGSLMQPGGASLSLLLSDGTRQLVAQGEVTFLGWTYR